MDGRRDLGWSDPHWFRARLTFPFSDAILANSKAGLNAYGAPADRRYCFYNGFDFERIVQLRPVSEVRSQFGIKTPWVVGMVGAFEERKDYPTFLQAALMILEKRKDVSFLAVGDGSELLACRSMVPERFKDYIIFTGNQHAVESIINVFDVGVLVTNSRKGYREGISNAILEYMALGKPVVANRDGGTPEIVLEGETGLMVRENNASDWAEKISSLLDDPALGKSMGEAGKQRVQRHFNLKQMTSDYFNLYQSMLGIYNKIMPSPTGK